MRDERYDRDASGDDQNQRNTPTQSLRNSSGSLAIFAAILRAFIAGEHLGRHHLFE